VRHEHDPVAVADPRSRRPAAATLDLQAPQLRRLGRHHHRAALLRHLDEPLQHTLEPLGRDLPQHCAAPDDNQPFIQTTPLEYKLNLGSAGAAFFDRTLPSANTTATVPAPLRRYMVRIYFVAKCNVPSSGVASDPCDAAADGGSPIPTLKMLELGVHPTTLAGPQFNKLAVAEGIEHLQFEFGIDTTGDGVADTVSTCGGATPCTALDFSNVVTVQVYIVARNTETSPAYFDDKTYRIGVNTYTAVTNSPYRRHSYSSLVRLNNIAMRRE